MNTKKTSKTSKPSLSPLFLLLLLIFQALILPTASSARSIVSTGSFTQFGRPSKERLEKARATAVSEFRPALHFWLKENMRIDLDTTNSIKKFALEKLASRCLESAEEKSVVNGGRLWTVSLTVSDGDVRDALSAHNEYFEALAATRFQEARGNDLNAALPGAIGALCAAMSRITPAESGGGANVEDIRANVQILFDKMSVKSATTVVDGRPGSFPQRSPDAVFSIDGAPLTGFHLTATVQGGRVLAQFETDERGGVPLREYKVPFVHNGSMLNVTPDARKYIESESFVRYKDLGVRLNKGQDLSYIYKVPALTYGLEYKASSLSKSIPVPPDFVADAHVRKYLKEQCGLIPASSRGSADMNIKIVVEFSQETHNDTEEDGYVMRAVAEFRGGGVERSAKTQFEKRVNFGFALQMGEYFWEASGALKKLIADALSQDN